MDLRKRIVTLSLALSLFTSFLIGPVAGSTLASDGGMMHDGMMGSKKMYMHRMMKHHKMMDNMMKMLKETMVILRDLSHRPTEAQKKKLEEMIEKMDKMIKMHNQMMMKMKQKMQQKMQKQMEGGY